MLWLQSVVSFGYNYCKKKRDVAWGADPGRAAVGGTDEKQNEYKSLRTRREPATAPAWALSWGIEMAKTENRKPKTVSLLTCGGVGPGCIQKHLDQSIKVSLLGALCLFPRTPRRRRM